MAELLERLTLHRASCPALGEAEFLAALPASLVGFAYGTERALWVRSREGGLEYPPDELGVGLTFELRLFNEQEEWRWVRGAGGARVATTALNRAGWEPRELPPVHADASPAYLLWGASLGEHRGGWTRVGSPRTGPFWVPIADIAVRRSVALRRVRYFGQDSHGNVSQIEERLLGLVPAAHGEGT